ncbi:MAG: hypothetical protein ABSD49_15525 [Candidatus Bathyarchaeia archaeon]|jgi:hypothetical protein
MGKCIILGAGASFGYDETLSDIEKPPLTNEVFKKGYQLGILTRAEYPRLYDKLIFYFNNILGGSSQEPTGKIDVEAFLNWLAEQFESFSQRISARTSQQSDEERTGISREANNFQGAIGEGWYFLFDIMRHYSISYKARFDAYRRLALHYFDQPYSTISLNYDAVFEFAILSVGLGINYGGGDGTPLSIPIAKVHGSVNWVNPIGRGIAIGGLTGANILQTIAPFIYSNRLNVGAPRILALETLHKIRVRDLLRSGTDYDEPILIPPIGNHKDYEKVKIFQQMWGSAERMIGEATELVFIGTTLRKQDTRLCEALKKNLKQTTKLVIVRGKSKVIATLKEILP